jgi:hypothetical protein
MKFVAAGLTIAVGLAAATPAWSQSFDDLQISVRGSYVRQHGAESRAVWFSTGPLVVGKSTSILFSAQECPLFSVSAGHLPFAPNTTTAWRVDVTPTRVVDRAVTFRLRWSRVLNGGKPSTSPADDTEVTLRPGESRPIDSLAIPAGAKRPEGTPCDISAATLRVEVDGYPEAEFDTSLLAADLWLVERTAEGSERSQHLLVRGRPNRQIPFYFENVVEGAVTLEIFGGLVAHWEGEALRVSLQTRSRSTRAANPSWLPPARSVESVIDIKGEETVEIALPKLGDAAGPFANRQLSIRVRARQLR